MESKIRPLRIVWAVDPLGEEFSFQVAGAKFLRTLADRTALDIYPIYLYGSYPLEYSPYSPVEIDSATCEKTKSTLTEICEGSSVHDIKDLEIVVKGFTSLKEGVQSLIDRALELDADAIFATTHARKGVTRWIIGSFTEALMEKSTVPLFILNPESKVEWTPAAALFATDLSPESRCAFRRFLPVANAFHSKVTIYHQGVHSLSEGLVPAFTGAHVMVKGEKAEKENQWSEAVAKVWRGSAKSAGAECEVLVDETLSRSPAEGALEKAEGLKAWIAIAAQSKPTPIGLIGSNARRVLRDARVPVWLYRAPRGASLCDPIDFGERDIAHDLRLGAGVPEGSES